MVAPTSRETLIEYCLRDLGAPVLEINVDPDQLEDRVDEALQYYQEYHGDATYRDYIAHQLTDSDLSNEFIPIGTDVLFVNRLFPIRGGQIRKDFFDIKYQLHLNDIANLQTYMGDMAYYEQIQQYLSLIDMKLNGTPQIEFNRKMDRIYIFGDLTDGDLEVGDYVVYEAYRVVDPNTFNQIWNDKWLKKYTTALIKKQWGSNLIKFEGMQLPGGVTINGRQIYEDALQEIEKLEEDIRLSAEFPPDFYVG